MWQPGSLKTITTDKLASFAIGTNKKSRFQKAKEEKEAKDKAEAEAAAQVYNSFVASFEGDDDDDNNAAMPMKTFVKEGSSKTKNMESLLNEMKQKERNDNKRNLSSHPSPYTNNNSYSNISNNTSNNDNNNNKQNNNSSSNSKDRVKEMDLFLEELKNKNTNSSDHYHHQRDNYLPSTYDENITTNLYVGNINPNITEERLYELFRKYGEINSIKIMWPRSEEERIRRRNCGFVSFMKRKVHNYSI